MGSRYEVHIRQGGGGGPGPPGPPGPDHFAPKYVVGNVPAGDDPVAYNLNGFQYIPDTGNGAGIALALTQPNGPGDVWIRPGTYNLTAPLVVPSGVRVQGSGFTTLLRGGATAQNVFNLGSNSQLRDLRISVTGAAVVAGASVVLCNGTDGRIDNVEISYSCDAAGQLRNGVEAVGPFAALGFWYATRLTVTALTVLGAADPVRCVLASGAPISVSGLVTTGGDVGMAAVGTGAVVAIGFICSDWTVAGAQSTGSSSSLHLENGYLRAAAAAVTPVGLDLQDGSSHQFVGVSADAASQVGSFAVRIAAGSNAAVFYGCRFLAWHTGIFATACAGTSVVGCEVRSLVRSLDLNSGADRWKISESELISSASTGIGIFVTDTTGFVLSDSRVQHIGPAFRPAISINVSTRARIHDLDLDFTGLAGIQLFGSLFCSVHSNTILSQSGTVGVLVQTPGSETNSVIGNVVEGTATPVTDNGTDTEVAHNLGAI